MKGTPISAAAVLLIGLGVCAAILAAYIMSSRIDHLGLVSFLLRVTHILGGMIWVGMIWFVNFIQLAVVQTAEPADRSAIMRLIVPRVAATFRNASHLTVISGALLLVSSGYLFDRWVFPSAVYVPGFKSAMVWGGAIAAMVMWYLVHVVISPSLRVVLGETPGDEASKEVARGRVLTAARINLLLAIPVTFAMIGAAHLY